MRSILGYIVMIVCIVIYGICLSEPMTKKIAEFKYKSDSPLGSDKYRYGALYGMAFLPEFKLPLDKTHINVPVNRCDPNKKSINLYALCDSYIWSFLASDSFYCNVDKFQYATSNKQDRLDIHLDTTKSNVLLIEMLEQNICWMVQNNYTYLKEFVQLRSKNTAPVVTHAVSAEGESYLFNKNINTNIEFNIFETSLFSPIKELKATLNYKLFKRVDNNVAISPDSKYLLFNQTLDPTSYTSSFKNITDPEVDSIVSRLNQLYGQYKQMGFKEVYFAFIPNPVSVLFPDFRDQHYNNLILRIQDHPNNKLPMVKVFDDFKNAKTPLYQQADTHWNLDGAHTWLNKFNELLKQLH